MAYTAAQQKRLDDAQKQVDNTRPAYDAAVANYNAYRNAITCYNGTVPSIAEASIGVTASQGSCYGGFPKATNKGCSQSDRDNCQNLVGQLNNIYMPALSSAYTAYNGAVNNYNTVLAQVKAESGADPTNIQQTQVAIAAAQAAEMVKKYKYFFGIVAFLVIGFLVFGYFKWWRKKKA